MGTNWPFSVKPTCRIVAWICVEVEQVQYLLSGFFSQVQDSDWFQLDLNPRHVEHLQSTEACTFSFSLIIVQILSGLESAVCGVGPRLSQ